MKKLPENLEAYSTILAILLVAGTYAFILIKIIFL